MKLSCGIVVFNEKSEILLGHPTGNPWNAWNIPKGHIEPNESEIECAIRETYEETSLKFESNQLTEHGRFKYLRDKDLHLFSIKVSNVLISDLKCLSFVNNEFPEFDAFKYIQEAKLRSYVSKPLFEVLKNLL